MKSLSQVILEYKEKLLLTHSPVTVKNYISDIWHFTNWYANYFGKEFSLDLLTQTEITEYKKARGGLKDSFDNSLSKQSIERHISSLRSFAKYLQDENLITANPFDQSLQASESEDDWKISEFKAYLRNKNSSDLTIKYYINDISGFRKWIHEVTGGISTNTLSSFFNEEMIDEYKQRLTYTMLLSPVSINRKLSSIRNYAQFLKLEIDNQNISKSINSDQNLDLEELSVPIQEKNYPKNIILRTAVKTADAYNAVEEKTAQLVASQIASSSSAKLFTPQDVEKRIHMIDEVLNTLKHKNIQKEFYAPHAVSLQGKPTHKKILHHIRHTRPKWYKEYHTYPFVHYLHLGLFIVATVVAGVFIYNGTLGKAKAEQALNTLQSGTKILTFNGRLLDKDNNPIKEETSITFALYTTPTKNDGLVWQERQDRILPKHDGSVNLMLGSKNPIPKTLEDSDIPLYLGVTIGNGEELTPRKPIGAAFSKDSEMVQGMVPLSPNSGARNVLLALDSTGNLAIGGSANPTFQATGGNLTLTGEALILASNPSSHGNVIISPDGNGKIEVNKALISSVQGSLFGFSNVVEVEGGLGVSATSSTHAALMINQNSRGQLLIASTGGITKFVVDNQGSVTRGIWEGDIIGTRFGGLGTNANALGPGEILYSTSTTSYAPLKAGVKGQCLTSQGTTAPLWSACGGFTQINGSLISGNSTLDFLIGGDSSTSAKFALLNVGNGTPTFKIGNALGLTADGQILTYDKDLKIGSSSTKNILLASSGNVGIGTSNPTRTFDLTGTFGGNVDLYTDGSGTRTVERPTKALIYDLEKSTGTTNSDGITTYNITGLPDVDGTIAYIYLKASKGITASATTQTVQVQINGVALATVSTTNPLLASDEVKHLTVLRSNGTWHVQGDPGTSNTADLAEWTEFTGEMPYAGNIVSINNDGKLTLSNVAHDKRLAGIVATKPAITLGLQTKETVRLTLSGRIPAIVTNINGNLVSGDTITSSLIPGVGMKPTRNSPIVGKALNSFSDNNACKVVPSLDAISWPEDDGRNLNRPCFKVPVASFTSDIQNKLLKDYGYASSDFIAVGKIIVLANLSWSNSEDFLTAAEGISITEPETTAVQDKDLTTLMEKLTAKTYSAKLGEKVIEETSYFGKIIGGSIQAGIITTSDAVVKGSLAAYNIVGNSVTAISADFENLTAAVVTAGKITSPVATIPNVKTDTIEPISEDIKVKLASPSSEFQVTNGNNQVVSSIDSEGNVYAEGIQARSATFSGQIASNNLSAQEASIAGTLRANNLIAENIEGLENQVSTFARSFLDEYEVTSNIPTPEFGDSLMAASVSASFGTFHHGLLSLGASTFGSISAIDQITIGTNFIFANNSINTIGSVLEIQPLRQGAISLMAGAVVISQDGKLVVSEDATFAKSLTVKGNLFANSISNIPGQDVNLRLQGSDIHDSKFMIHNSASDSAVFSVNPQGNVTASGSGTFSKINFNLVGQAVAANDLEAYATSSAGTAVIKTFRPELTIYNGNVTENSLIYITPKNNTDNNVLYLIRQTPQTDSQSGSFTVGVSQLIDHDVNFNWLIVN